MLQIFASLFDLTLIKAVAAATTASPAPQIFTTVRGLETFSTKFHLEWSDKKGEQHAIVLTPDVYSWLKGPYNRRNVYGAVLAFGPVLATEPKTREMFLSVSRYALCDEAPLLREMGIDPASIAGDVRIRLEPLHDSKVDNLPLVFDLQCL